MDLFELVAKLSLDKSEYEQGLGDAQESASSFGGKVATAAKVGVGAVTAVTAATAAAGAAFVKGAGDVASYGDTIDKQSQKMGISAQAYQEWDAVLQHSGTDISVLSRGMTTLSQKAEKGDAAFEKLGITQEQLQSMNQEELFAKTIEGLQGMESGTERTVLAQSLLGGSAKQLGALLNTSAEDTQKMKERVHELGGVMSDDAVKAAAAYQDSLQDMTTAIDGVKRGIMSNFLPSLTTAMDGIGMLFSGDSEQGLGKIKEGASQFIQTLSDTIPKVIEIGGNIIISLTQAIVENLPSILEAGIQAILSLAKGIGDALPELIPAVVDAVLTMVETLVDNIDLLIDAALQLMIGLAEGLIKAIPVIIEKIPVIITKLITALVESAPKIAEAGITLFVSLVKNLPQIIASIVSAVPKIIAGLVSAFGAGVSKMVEVGKKLFTSLGSALASGVGTIKQKAGNLLTAAKDAFKNGAENMKTIGTNLATGLRNGISGAVSKVREITGKVFEAVKNVFTNAPKALASIGRNLMIGLYNGIVEKAQAVIDKVKGVADSMIGWAKNILGINSPSKVFHQIGQFVDLGMAGGIEGNLDKVQKAMKDMSNLVMKEVPQPEIDMAIQNQRNRISSSFGMGGQMISVPRQETPRNITVILELDRMQLARAVYQLNNQETQRVGMRLAGGYA